MNTSCTTGATNIVQLPLAFVRSGYIRLQDGQAQNVGLEASTRSRTSSSAAYAYYLNSNDTGVNPSDINYYRYRGFPLRCLYQAKA